MSKKRFMALPAIALVVSMMAASAFAASPTPGTHPVKVVGNLTEDEIIIIDGEDVEGVMGKKATDLGLSADTLQMEVDKVDKNIKAADLEVYVTFGAYLRSDYESNGPETKGSERHVYLGGENTITVSCASESTDAVLVLHFEEGAWKIVGKADSTTTVTFTVSYLSPFAVVKASAPSSAQTGEYAGAYIVMVAVALVAAGAIFAIRAKKATK